MASPDLTDPATFLDVVTGAWKCIGCGGCCHQVPLHPELFEAGFDRGDGTCRHLGRDQRCEIYERRPASCRVTAEAKADPEKMSQACAFVNRLGKVPVQRALLHYERGWLQKLPAGFEEEGTR